MSERFLDQILTTEIVMAAPRVASLLQVGSDSDHSCCICLLEIGTLSSETGIIECEIRLPCSHLMGSACIATWLRSNNTCPICRQAFFTAQPQSQLEYDHILAMSSEDEDGDGDGDGDEDEDDEEGDEEEEEGEDATFIGENFCQALGFSSQVTEIVHNMAKMLEDKFAHWLPDQSPQCVAATTAYIISHTMNLDASMAYISDVSGIHVDLIQSSYRILHHNLAGSIGLPRVPLDAASD